MRLIDADEIRIKSDFILYGVCGTPVIRCEDLARIINDMPTIEPQPTQLMDDDIEPDREVIEDEVWELADYMCRMGVQERDLCFGFQLTTEVTANLSYQEAKAKFEAWLKQEDEIRVGDEIYSDGDYEKSVVMEIHGDGSVSVYTKNGCIEHWWNKMHNLKKTGRHFMEVAELLEKMRGEQDG